MMLRTSWVAVVLTMVGASWTAAADDPPKKEDGPRPQGARVEEPRRGMAVDLQPEGVDERQGSNAVRMEDGQLRRDPGAEARSDDMWPVEAQQTQ